MRSELFKTALQSYKDELAKCLQEGGEGKRVAAFLEKIDHQIPLSQHMFDVAWNHRQTEVDELQKRVDAATAKWISIISILTTTESNVPDVIYQQLDELHDALCGYELEQALKGGGE